MRTTEEVVLLTVVVVAVVGAMVGVVAVAIIATVVLVTVSVVLALTVLAAVVRTGTLLTGLLGSVVLALDMLDGLVRFGRLLLAGSKTLPVAGSATVRAGLEDGDLLRGERGKIAREVRVGGRVEREGDLNGGHDARDGDDLVVLGGLVALVCREDVVGRDLVNGHLVMDKLGNVEGSVHGPAKTADANGVLLVLLAVRG